jgi:hypothetical protein
MRRLATGALLIGLLAIPPRAAPEPDGKEGDPAPVLTLELHDGSQISGAACSPLLPVKAVYGNVKLPVKLVKSVTFQEQGRMATVRLKPGDIVRGPLKWTTVDVRTAMGEVSVGVPALKRFTAGPPARRSGAAVSETPRFVMDLKCGSRLIGTLKAKVLRVNSVPVGHVDIPWKHVTEARRRDAKETAEVKFLNSDLLVGVIEDKEQEITTALGTFRIPTKDIVRVRRAADR